MQAAASPRVSPSSHLLPPTRPRPGALGVLVRSAPWTCAFIGASAVRPRRSHTVVVSVFELLSVTV